MLEQSWATFQPKAAWRWPSYGLSGLTTWGAAWARAMQSPRTRSEQRCDDWRRENGSNGAREAV
jgi:hypothetical protein